MTVNAEFDACSFEHQAVSGVGAHHGTATVIQLAGECDLAQRDKLRRVIDDVFGSNPECVILDLSGLSFIDSTGIQAVLDVSKQADRKGVRLSICHGPPSVQRVFEVCGLTGRLPFVSDPAWVSRSRETPQHDP